MLGKLNLRSKLKLSMRRFFAIIIKETLKERFDVDSLSMYSNFNVIGCRELKESLSLTKKYLRLSVEKLNE